MRGRMLMLAAGHKMGQQQAKKQMAQAEALKQEGAEEAKQQMANPVVTAPPSIDVTAELQKLADLKNSGVLTEEEFTAAKKKLLGL